MDESTKGQVEELLQELGKKIDHLIEEARGAKDHVRDEVEEKIEELKNRKEIIEKEIEAYKKQSEPKWHEFKLHLNHALEELKKAAEVIFKSDNTNKGTQ